MHSTDEEVKYPVLIGLTEAARRIGLPRYQLAEAGRRGQIVVVTVGGRYYVREDDLLALVGGSR